MHLVHLKQLMKEETLDPKIIGQYKLQSRNIEAQLGQRTGQILHVKEYADVITDIIAYPGLRKDFKSGTFESFVIGRNVEVSSIQPGLAQLTAKAGRAQLYRI